MHEVTIENHTIILEPYSFALVVIMEQPLGVLVNFSLDPTIYTGFQEGLEIQQILQEPGLFMGLAENDFNLNEIIYIDNIAPHYLYYQSDNAHRFSSVLIEDGYIICKRKISYFAFLDGVMARQSISTLKGKSLYLSFLYSEWGKNFERITRQVDFLKIAFR